MKTCEQAVSLFWVLVAAFTMVESLRMGIGTASVPGMGFMPFYAAAILGTLASVQLLRTFSMPAADFPSSLFSRWTLLRVGSAMAGLLIYTLILPIVGYVISTFVLMLFLFWLVQPAGRWSILFAALLTTFATHLVFQALLDSQFPRGPLGF